MSLKIRKGRKWRKKVEVSGLSSTHQPESINDMHEIREDTDGSQGCSSSVYVDKLQSTQTRSSDSDGSPASKETVSSRDHLFEDECPGLDAVIREIQEIRETQRTFEKFLQTMQTRYHRDHLMILQAIEEEKSRWDVLEQELADLTELYQREASNLKEEITSTQEMIDFQSHDRTQEFSEALETYQSHLLKLELTQQQQVDTNRPNDTVAQIVLGKVIKGLLVVMSTLLVFVCSMNRAVLFFKSSSHILSALLLAVLLFLVIKYWNNFPELHLAFNALGSP
ncbi:transmembrane and coiled-coil domains protein 1-like [Fundulus heteroclitus]|uniref:transmembrane and coiled-coil domains protein 1-like n=1 Tax=Fundulus heteroclitus TaxID=8078 RepID=UPI00165C2CB3|nr:transmembrane and coiled-coil domains protein 1-like [Fundulus heteroclitus]